MFFIRDKEKREVDFLITQNKKPWILVECKSRKGELSPHLIYYKNRLGTSLNFQLVDRAKEDRLYRLQNIRVMGYEKFFSGFV